MTPTPTFESEKEHAAITSCDVEEDPENGPRLVATVQLGEQLLRYKIETSRKWRLLDQEPLSAEKQRLVDAVLWGYLRDFTGEIDARQARRQQRTG